MTSYEMRMTIWVMLAVFLGSFQAIVAIIR